MDADTPGIPPDQRWHLNRDTSAARLLALIAVCLSVLTILALIDRGALSGWSDILRPAHAHE